MKGLVPRSRQFLRKIHNLFDLHQKPAVNFCEVEIFSIVKPARRAWRMKKMRSA
jgi:hypothetical protein